MRRIEKILLSKVPVWIVVVVLMLAAAGTVGFGALVEHTASRKAALHLNNEYLPGLGRVALVIAGIPRNLHRLLFGRRHPAEARRQRFDGQAGLAFAFADAAGSPGDGGRGYLFLARYLPKPTLDEPEGRTILLELIDLSLRKAVHVWYPDTELRDFAADVLPDGSLVLLAQNRYVARLDACANVEWWKLELKAHHSIERDADGNFWTSAKSSRHRLANGKDELLKLSSDGDVLARISLTDALTQNGYRHLLYDVDDYKPNPLHVNDVQPVLRDGPFWRRGDLFVSLRTNSVVLLYRPATDEVVWLRQGPWLHQHDVDVVGDSEISVFSNNSVITWGGEYRVLGANEVYVYDFATGEARSPWREAMRRHDVRTVFKGAATLFGDGGLMVEEHNYGRVLRFSADGALRWSYVNRASDGRVYRLGWSRYLDADYGAEVMRSAAAAGCERSGPEEGAVR